MNSTPCRFCATPLRHLFANLGMSPLSNAFLNETQLFQMEPTYPLKVYVCERCFLVQLPEFESPQNIFKDYAYFSSYSETWLAHSKQYTQMAVDRFEIGPDSLVCEIGSNDGYLLRFFVERGVPVLGVEPAENVAKAAVDSGIPTMVEFFNQDLAGRLAAQDQKADLLIGNNVLAQIPDINDCVAAMKTVLSPHGVMTLEFPHLMRLINDNQFDTIYHEHFFYFSFTTIDQILAHFDLTVFDVDELPTHGGSLRVYARHREDGAKEVTKRVPELKQREQEAGFDRLESYRSFDVQVQETKRRLLRFLTDIKDDGKTIVGYGAPAKGNTLLNYCGIRSDYLDYTVDLSPHKQNLFLPGTHIPIHSPDKIAETRPDFLLILPWNLKNEIMEQMRHVRSWGGKFIVPIPQVGVY